MQNRGRSTVTGSTCLQNAAFRRLFTAVTISRVGNALSIIAMMTMVLEFTGTAASWGYLLATQAAAYVLFGPIAGRMTDRVDRRVVAASSCLARAAIFIAMTQVHSTSALYVLGFAAAGTATFFEPAVRSLISTILDDHDLLSANALIETTNSMVSIFGMVISGALIIAVGWTGLLALNAASIIWCAILVMTISRERTALTVNSEPVAAPMHPIELQLKPEITGGEYLRNAKELHYPFALRTIMLVMNGLVGPLLFGLVALRDWGGVSATAYLVAAIGIGSVIASRVLSGRTTLPISSARRLALLLAFDAMAIWVIATSPSYGLAWCFALMLGVTETFLRVQAATEIQQLVPEHVAGRVFATMSSVHEPARVMAFAIAGVMIATGAADQGLKAVAAFELVIVAACLVWFSRGGRIAQHPIAIDETLHASNAMTSGVVGSWVDPAPIFVATPAAPPPLAAPVYQGPTPQPVNVVVSRPLPSFVPPPLPEVFTRRAFSPSLEQRPPARPEPPPLPAPPRSDILRAPLNLPRFPSMVQARNEAKPTEPVRQPAVVTTPERVAPRETVTPRATNPLSKAADRAVDERDLARSS